MTWTAVILACLGIALVLSAVMAAAWAIQQKTGNSGWVDTVWTFGLGGVALAAGLWPLQGPWPSDRQLMVGALIAVWSLRLGWHIASRTRGISDDPRYRKLIEDWGADARRQMFWLLQKQALVSIPLALSVFVAAQNPLPGLRAQDIAGLLILVVAIGGEALADRQLRRFRSNRANAGAVCDTGLWRWSRHPNYFFEWFGWLAYPVIAIDLSAAYPAGWIALVGPVCMYWLLVHVSGIPPLEQHMLESRGDAFRAYQRRTSAFFPMPARGGT